MGYDILKYVITTLIGAIITALIAYLKTLKSKLKEAQTDSVIMHSAVKQLLRADLKRQCRYYIKKGSITVEEFEELTEELEVYEALDGNGTVHILYDAVKEIAKKP